MQWRPLTAFVLTLTIVAASFTAVIWPARPARGEETTFTATDDATLKSGSPNQNFGSDSTLDINDTRDGVVKFDISSIPASATITSAALKLKVTAINGSNSRIYNVHRVLSSWSEGSVTWNSPGSSSGTNFSASATDSESISSTGTYNYDVTTDVAAFVAGSASNHGWRVIWASNESGTNKQLDMGTRENSGNEPQLTVVYSSADTTAPAAVSNLTAAAASATSLTTTWTAPGDDGSTGTAASYDLRYATSAITSGNFSSASAATGEPTPAAVGGSESATVTGLAPNTLYYAALKTSDEVPNASTISNVPSAYTLANSPVAAAFGTATDTSIVTDWLSNSNAAATEYYVENQTASTNSGWITDTTWTATGLTAETSYIFRVKARNGAGTETAWVSLGTKATAASSSTSSSTVTATTSTTTSTTTTASAVPAATGPQLAAPTIAPAPEAAAIGAPGTTTPNTSTGETATAVPILPTVGDTAPPTIALDAAPEVTEQNKFTAAGEANEVAGEFSGVIASLAYSFDNGISWHPVTAAEGLGTANATFTITSPPLPDGTYDIRVRARDNSGNEGMTEQTQATIDVLPVIFGSAVLLKSSGDALATLQPTIIAGAPLRLIAAFEGGVTEAKAHLNEQEFALEPDAIKRRFSGTLTLTAPGAYSLKLAAQDGAGHTFDKEVGRVTVVPALKLVDYATQEALAGGTVTLEKYDEEAQVWRTDTTPGQSNPQETSEAGTVLFEAGRGVFRLRVSAAKYWNAVTSEFTLRNPAALTGAVRLPRRPWYKYLLPFLTRPAPVPADSVLAIAEPSIIKEARNIELAPKDTGSTERALDEFLGHRVLLTTVAAWNRSSQEQLVVLQRLQDRIGGDVVVVPWLIQQPGSVLAGILHRGGYSLTGFVDATGQDTEALERSLFPSHYLFDREGVLRTTRTGFATVDELIDLLADVQ